jgi:organic hydroperoxide reductase OsmC/OhrA
MASQHKVQLEWLNHGNDLQYETYSRSHTIKYEGGIEVKASAALQYKGNAIEVNPEEQLVAAVSSCHMLTFLAIASRKKMIVKSYSDNAIGTLAINAHNKMAITHVLLNPIIVFETEQPNDEMMQNLHHRSHLECFIANSVNFPIEVKGF